MDVRRTLARVCSSHLQTTLVLVCSVGLTSCTVLQQPLESPPWSRVVAGTHAVGLSTGWAVYEGEIELNDRSGAPDLGSGSDTADFEPLFGLAAKYQYFLSPHIALGGLVEQRSFDPDIASPIGIGIDADDFTTYHFVLSSRFFTDPLGEDRRWKAFAGLDLGYVPDLDLDATAVYAPGFQQRVAFDGDSYLTLGAVAGLSYLIFDRLSLEFGAFYEWTVEASEDTITFDVPSGLGVTNPNDVGGEVRPQGLIGFVGLTYYL